MTSTGNQTKEEDFTVPAWESKLWNSCTKSAAAAGDTRRDASNLRAKATTLQGVVMVWVFAQRTAQNTTNTQHSKAYI